MTTPFKLAGLLVAFGLLVFTSSVPGSAQNVRDHRPCCQSPSDTDCQQCDYHGHKAPAPEGGVTVNGNPVHVKQPPDHQ